MFSVEHTQEPWAPEETQGESLVSSTSGQSRSELDNYTGEAIAGNESTHSVSAGNGIQVPFKIPAILRAAEKSRERSGQQSLPPEKAFSIQIGWRPFRLSGASIISDGKNRQALRYVV